MIYNREFILFSGKKDILITQNVIPASIERGLPAGAPRLSDSLERIFRALPINPDLPALPGGNGGYGLLPGKVADLIRGVEDMVPLPVVRGSPIVQTLAGGGGYRASTNEIPGVSTMKKVLGGGYRSE